ncbi:sulfurtransferase complex subunit TusC [Halomonas daqiaonensis]|uniref:tRNA 2-thiouridine synthesizing protein C n=1 Tax=Halomonas daqiaonensis TaxID=650850 RepID=A0A1H7F9P7_9GAMM|nr:sulfurtransferase complex subunit TusC [Halomonas daqiaonensis]SEK22067.1 tRNA 2-thiouridine synthesizing protein C [Halomonas daqiaonensis]
MQEPHDDGDLLVILRHGPHGSSWLKEGLDAALVAAAFGRRVSLLFMGEGVTALIADQQVGALGQKGTAATLEMLEMYDIETLLVEAQGLSRLGLSRDDLMLEVECLSPVALARVLSGHRLVLTF